MKPATRSLGIFIYIYLASLLTLLISMMSALTLPYSKHLGATCWTGPLSRRLAIFHGDSPGVPHFSLGSAFHTVRLH